jgi:fructoselysine 6-kinase
VELCKRFPGGNALNFTVYASRQGGVKADYIGIIGTDYNGRYLLNQIKKEGLETHHIMVKEGPTAVTKVLIRDGERIFEDHNEGVQGNAFLQYEKIPNPENYDLIHFTVWGFGREHVQKIKETTNIILSCDFSVKLNDSRTDIMPYLDYSFFSGNHLIEKGKDPELALRNLKKNTPGIVVMTLGENGSMIYDGVSIYRGKAIPVNVVDTLGAGDSYIASFLISQLNGDTIPESIKKGHLAAKKICKRLGAWGGEY